MLTVPPTPFPTRRYSDLPMITHSLMSATDSPAMKAAIDHAKLLEKRDDIYAVTVMAGFALADIAAPCLSVIVVGRDQKVAQSTADELAGRIWEDREGFIYQNQALSVSVARAKEMADGANTGANGGGTEKGTVLFIDH